MTNKEYKIKKMKSIYCYCFICQKRTGSWYYECTPEQFKKVVRRGDGRIIYRPQKNWKKFRKTQWKI